MSGQDRSRLYAWLCEQTDEPLAEYVMSCLPPAQPSDLVTKEFLTATLTATLSHELSGFATKEELAAVDAKVVALDAKVNALDVKVDLLAAQFRSDRDEDRRVGRVRHYWLAGIAVSIWVSVGLPVWLGTAGVIG